MSFKSRLQDDLKNAMKAGDSERVGLLRLLTSAIRNKEIEKRTKEKATADVELTDDEVLQSLQTEAKKRKESIDIFIKGGRQDLADKEQKELILIQVYLPKQMSVEETEKSVEEIIKKSGGADFSSVMKVVMQELRGKVDAKMVSELVKKKLGK